MTTPNVPKWSLVKGNYGIYYAERASDKARFMLQSSPSKSKALIASLNAMPPDPSLSTTAQRAADAERERDEAVRDATTSLQAVCMASIELWHMDTTLRLNDEHVQRVIREIHTTSVEVLSRLAQPKEPTT